MLVAATVGDAAERVGEGVILFAGVGNDLVLAFARVADGAGTVGVIPVAVACGKAASWLPSLRHPVNKISPKSQTISRQRSIKRNLASESHNRFCELAIGNNNAFVTDSYFSV